MGQDTEPSDLRKPSYSEWRAGTELSSSRLMTLPPIETFRELQTQHMEISNYVRKHTETMPDSTLCGSRTVLLSYMSIFPTARAKPNQHQKRAKKHTLAVLSKCRLLPSKDHKIKSLIAECNNQAGLITLIISFSLAVPKIFCRYCPKANFIFR